MFSCIQELEYKLLNSEVTTLSIINFAISQKLPFLKHPLGFIVCNLLSNDSLKARLHLWPKIIGDSQETLQIHDHTFNLKSWVLHGSIENIEYVKSELGSKFAVYSTSYSGNKSIIKKTEEIVMLIELGSSIYKAGSCYKVNAGEFHASSRKGKTVAATVLITEDVNKSVSLVAGPLNAADLYEYVRDEVSIEELSTIIAEF